MKTIWKFEITDSGNVQMPKGAEILSVQSQNNKPCIWAIVDTASEMEWKYFEVFGTGHDIQCDIGTNRKYIGTLQLDFGVLVFHVFERINQPSKPTSK